MASTISEYQALMASQQQKIDEAKRSAEQARQQISAIPSYERPSVSQLLQRGQAGALVAREQQAERGVYKAQAEQELSAYEAGIATSEKELASKTIPQEQLARAYVMENPNSCNLSLGFKFGFSIT